MATVAPNNPYTVHVAAQDDRQLAQVTLYLDGVLQQSFTPATAAFSADVPMPGLPEGSYTLLAEAVDAAGNQAAPFTEPLIVTPTPIVITLLTDGSGQDSTADWHGYTQPFNWVMDYMTVGEAVGPPALSMAGYIMWSLAGMPSSVSNATFRMSVREIVGVPNTVLGGLALDSVGPVNGGGFEDWENWFDSITLLPSLYHIDVIYPSATGYLTVDCTDALNEALASGDPAFTIRLMKWTVRSPAQCTANNWWTFWSNESANPPSLTYY